MAFAPPTVVPAPRRTALPFGLFSVLTPRTPAGGEEARWQNGITWEPLTCEPAGALGDPNCPPDRGGEGTLGLPKQFALAPEPPEFSPFSVYGSYQCSPVGHSPEYAMERATEHLILREESRVEQAIWTGDLGNDGFATGATSVGAALSPEEAVGALEQWIATEYGAMGVLHTSRAMATILGRYGLAKATGSTLYTPLGTPIVAGGGYPDEGGLIHATPALLGYRSEVFPGASPASAGFDRARNDLYAVAERSYVIGWDPCGTAVAGVTLT